ncbi:BTB/POZ domain containing protein [Acanthamoeba castellanii str. Neff]|uniref:protein-L-isoaspartate(D-aspartate) O-methyltransferase n=1 Tax=Acanthamoeba castellanii (strain ATCC 30010 / Neff) TaxID=1257118 RepID=L8GZG2_ACACF|nr:BTB/POZ domain containing protein [Acanthamoeba castellanii str. Neff]ELR17918.1 BTB/POZ domain containing protein [Acanthamoeba castellanii str. Neff]
MNTGGGDDQHEEEHEEEREEDEEEAARNNAFLHHLLAAMVTRQRTNDTNDELIASLKRSGALRSPEVEAALRAVPRGPFVPADLADQAYVDTPLRLAAFGFNISAPHMYAMCLEALGLELGHTFLDIGSGCGHMTALGGQLVGKAGRADGIDLLPEYKRFAEDNLQRLKVETGLELPNLHFEVRNCFLPDLESLVDLLNPGGILVTPNEDSLVKVTKSADGQSTSIDKLASVRYGDLKVPSDAEIKEAQLALERKKATTIEIPPDTFVQDFARLLNNPDLSDVTFVVEGRKVPAHRFILQVRSEHFRAMFSNGLKESRDSEVVLHDTDYVPFMACLEFIYSGQVKIPDPDFAIELIGEANKLQLVRLKALCEDLISKNIDIENAAYVYQVGSYHAVPRLRSIALDFVVTNFDQVSKTKSFLELDRTLLLEVMQEACKLVTQTRGNGTSSSSSSSFSS